MIDIIQREQISSYRVAALFHQWGFTPNIIDPNQVNFSHDGYDFICFVKEQTLLLYFGNVIFNESGTSLDEIKLELGSITKRIQSGFSCFSAFYLEDYRVGLEVTYELPITPVLVSENLILSLNNYLASSIKGINYLMGLGYVTEPYYSSSKKQSVDVEKPLKTANKPQTTPASSKREGIPKNERCFSCEGDGQYSCGTVCSICDGHGVSKQIMVQRQKDSQSTNKRYWGDPSFNLKSSQKPEGSSSRQYYIESSDDYSGDSIGWSEGNSMLDDNMSDYSAEMGHDGDDY